MAVFRDHDTDSKESLIHHNAGIAGVGGSSYIDSVILRDRDANTAWTAASDGTLEERRYLVQNWRADVTTMVNTSGEPIEWYRYTAYGQPTSHPIADINGDGSVTSADTAAWLDVQAGDSSGSVWLTDDLNRDDVFPGDTADDTFFYAQQSAASGLSSGYDRQSAYGLRKGYAGYEWDDTLAMWHVRHRVVDSKSGKWTKRDPLGYVDGVSDVEYVVSHPIRAFDSTGLRTDVCASGMRCGISQPGGPGVFPQPIPKPEPPRWPIEGNPPGFPGGCVFPQVRSLEACQTWARCVGTGRWDTPGVASACNNGAISRATQRCSGGGDLMQCITQTDDVYRGCYDTPDDHCNNVSPLAPGPACNMYPVCYSYSGANARCFCKYAGTSDWSNFVRACLPCKYRHHNGDLTPEDGNRHHSECYNAAGARYPGRPWATLLGRFAKCAAVQVAECSGEQ